MSAFRYCAVTATGETVDGVMEAESKAAVVDRLRGLGHVPIRADQVGLAASARGSGTRLFQRRAAGRDDLMLFTRQLATLLHAGLPIDRALTMLGEIGGPRLQPLVAGLVGRLEAGEELSEAMTTMPAVFSPIYVALVRAGEAAADVEGALIRLAEYLERAAASRAQISSALMYPFIVLLTCGGSLAALFLLVVPRFRPMFEQAGDNLPVATQIVLAISDGLAGWGWLMLVVAALAIPLVRVQLRRPAARAWADARLIRLPLVGGIIVKSEVGRFCRTLGTLLASGVSLLGALEITRGALSNATLAGAVDAMAESAKRGRGIAEPLARNGLFPPIAVQLIRIGEEAAKDDEMLLRAARILEDEAQRTIERLLALLAPLLTVVLGVIVAAVIGSILLAILSVYDLAT